MQSAVSLPSFCCSFSRRQWGSHIPGASCAIFSLLAQIDRFHHKQPLSRSSVRFWRLSAGLYVLDTVSSCPLCWLSKSTTSLPLGTFAKLVLVATGQGAQTCREARSAASLFVPLPNLLNFDPVSLFKSIELFEVLGLRPFFHVSANGLATPDHPVSEVNLFFVKAAPL